MNINSYHISDAMDTPGSTFLTDRETGLLYSNSAKGFTLGKKKKFVELASKYWPNTSLICALININVGTYRVHYVHDQVFRDKMDALTEAETDAIEASMAKFAKEKSNFMDRIAWLRAHRGEKYNERKMIQVDVNLTQERINAKRESLSHVIDTSIVDAKIVASVKSITVKTPDKPS